MYHKSKFGGIRKKEFSKKMILTFALFMIISFIISNIVVIGFAGSFRFFEVHMELECISKEIEKKLSENDRDALFGYLNNMAYEGYYVKITGKEDSLIFDTLTKYREFSDSKVIEKHRKFLKKEKELYVGGVKYRMILEKNSSDDKKTFAHFGFIFILMNFVVVAIGFYFSKKLTYKTLQPINDIIKTAENITASNLSGRVEISPCNDEIGRLGRVINEMMDRLEKSFVSQKNFISDASHELKTPLQIIKGYSELLAAWGSRDEKIRTEALEAIQEEIGVMTALIEKLLLLARFDNEASGYHKTEVDLTELIKKIRAGIVFAYPDIRINFSLKEPVLCSCDKELVRRALIAVIDNSAKYSFGKGIIDISLKSENGFAEIVIKDNGIGIDKESLGKVFDRFYRVDQSRTKETGGTGLGLAIVKNIIELHKGTVTMESEAGKGTVTTIKLPKE